MNLQELKENILNNKAPDNLIIFRCEENNFIAHEYINRIADNKNLTINYIDELVLSSNTFTTDYYLNVYIIDKLDNIDFFADQLVHTIIICNKINKNIEDQFKSYIIDIPKLERWHIRDYTKVMLPGLNKTEIDWLCNITNYDIYRLNNEICKLKIFPNQMQEIILNNMLEDNAYSDLSTSTIFDFTNALIKCNKEKLSNINFNTLDPFSVLGILIKQFKSIINIQLDSRATPQSLNISPKQFKAIEYSCGYYTNSQLIKIYEFLTEIDYKVKLGLLDTKYMLNYIINGIMSIKGELNP